MEVLKSYVCGRWQAGSGEPAVLVNATTEEPIASCSSGGIDFAAVLRHARAAGGPVLRELSFAGRGALLKALSAAIHEHREELIELSMKNAGTTRSDAKFDIDGATGTLAAYAAFAAELGERRFLVDGEGVQLGRTARFYGQHIAVPREGAAVHINAFNFPAWNMMEKAACALLAGVPVIEKPGTPTALVAARIAEITVESGILPEGSYQFIAGSVGDLLDHMGPQDALAFTGSSSTALKLRSNQNLLRSAARVNVEADSLNAAVLGPDVDPSAETFNLFLSNVLLDMTQKTGQKCTAVRRVVVPRERVDEVREALVERLSKVVVGDPSERSTGMGPLASAAQLRDVRQGIGRLASQGEIACGGAGVVAERGFFVAPTLLASENPLAEVFHREEVFGPAATLLPYSGEAEVAAEIVRLGEGVLVASVYSNDKAFVERVVRGIAPWSGRVWLGSDKMAEQAIPPGTVLPAMTHGGPGRAGGGEELGALRGLMFYMQRCALQGFKGSVEALLG
jgi:oxepin-CoA hydrolase/3-oxo-5,6-dehydrosuberyl-CoA semialdehyde dehydrogenase